jgi:GAF domain-containing protein
LQYQNEFIGTLVLYAAEDRPVPPEEISLLQALADQVAVAVHTAHHYVHPAP